MSSIPCASQSDDFLKQVIAHRGASYEAPENTTASIQLAIEKRAKIIEFDVRQTSDGVLFLFHDAELGRHSMGQGAFQELTAEQASQLDVGSWFSSSTAKFADQRPPTLSAAIQQCAEAGCTALIEHKTGSAEAYAKVLQQTGTVDKVVVQSFDWQFLQQIRDILPNLKIGALGKSSLSDLHEELIALNPDWVGWGERYIKKADIVWLKNQNFTVAIWTVNERESAKVLIEHGVDHIITDRPKYIAEGLL